MARFIQYDWYQDCGCGFKAQKFHGTIEMALARPIKDTAFPRVLSLSVISKPLCEILWLIMTQCCPRCPHKSTPSGINRHCKACKIYKTYMKSSQRVRQQLSEAKLNARMRPLAMWSQSQQHEPASGPDSIQIDHTVSVFVCYSSLEVSYQWLSR